MRRVRLLMIGQTLEGLNIPVETYFGYERVRRKPQIMSCLIEIWTFASTAYHGGRNEAL